MTHSQPKNPNPRQQKLLKSLAAARDGMQAALNASDRSGYLFCRRVAEDLLRRLGVPIRFIGDPMAECEMHQNRN